MERHYLDHNATTPLDPAIAAEMAVVQERFFANPSSPHAEGRAARCLLDECRERLAAVWQCKPSELVFTASATESNNTALFGAARLRRDRGRHIVASSVEHPSVRRPLERLAKEEGFEVAWAPVDDQGRVIPDAVEELLRPDTVLVSVQAANNETGVLQPVADIGRRCRSRGILFHVDAVQWFGKVPFEGIGTFEADLVSACAHKLHGPKGVGVLYQRSPLRLPALLHGGSQEDERRAGTENLPGIVGLVMAMERFTLPPVFDCPAVREAATKLEKAIAAIPGVHLLSQRTPRLPNTVAFAVEGADGLSLVANFDLEGFAVSSGSACSAGALKPSNTLRAMGLDEGLASALVRVSFGRDTTPAAVGRLTSCVQQVVNRARGLEETDRGGE